MYDEAFLRREKVKQVAAAAMEKARQVLEASKRNVPEKALTLPVPEAPASTSAPTPSPSIPTIYNKGEGVRRRREVKLDSLAEQLQLLSQIESDNNQIRETLVAVRDLCDRLLAR
jgi:hypothetical protein